LVGGSTPLSAGLLCSSTLIQRAEKQMRKSVVLFTDGRANVPLKPSSNGRDAVIADELKQFGVQLQKLGANVVVANTQRRFESTDEPKRLAQLLNAKIITLSDINNVRT